MAENSELRGQLERRGETPVVTGRPAPESAEAAEPVEVHGTPEAPAGPAAGVATGAGVVAGEPDLPPDTEAEQLLRRTLVLAQRTAEEAARPARARAPDRPAPFLRAGVPHQAACLPRVAVAGARLSGQHARPGRGGAAFATADRPRYGTRRQRSGWPGRYGARWSRWPRGGVAVQLSSCARISARSGCGIGHGGRGGFHGRRRGRGTPYDCAVHAVGGLITVHFRSGRYPKGGSAVTIPDTVDPMCTFG